MSKAKGKARQKARKQKGRPTQKKTSQLVPFQEAVKECRIAGGGCAFSPKLIEAMTTETVTIKEAERAAAESKNDK